MAADPLRQTPPWEKVPLEEQLARLREQMRRKREDEARVRRERDEWKRKAEQWKRKYEKAEKQKQEIESELKDLQLLFRKPLQPAWAKSQATSLREQGVKAPPKKMGPPRGHAPHVRKVPGPVTREVELIPRQCPHCNHSLQAKPSRWHTHTQIDLPPPVRFEVIRYRVAGVYCRHCQEVVYSPEKLDRSKYGPTLRAMVTLWKFGYGMTLPKIQALLEEQHELRLSTGELSEILSQNARRLRPYAAGVQAALQREKSLFADETGWRKNGDNHWLWSFSSPRLSFYTIQKSRGRKVVRRFLGKRYAGVLHSDFYGAYREIHARKQKCWAHLMRELRALKEKYPGKEAKAEISLFHWRAGRLYSRAKNLRVKFERGQDIRRSLGRLKQDTDLWLIARVWKIPELETLSLRVLSYRSELFTFLEDLSAEPTNNAAEREIRPAVLMRKTSYGNRSSRGAQTQAISMTLLRTARKQGIRWIPLASEILKAS